MDYDAFFLKITIYAALDHVNIFAHTEYIGGVASFYVTLLSGVLQPKTGNQLAQTGSALQLPYIHSGLGRTNNYLEDLTITVPRKVYYMLFSLIHNSNGPQSSQIQTSIFLLPHENHQILSGFFKS